ncbi:ATP-binding protein [Arthrobacter sp. L77]|uniref:ATP-binding protein n=1 Tax=Arthrobacter sp. L77 TaxID=1496689 RepID=UPI0005BB54ED|nr:ATP-binding protein [Arthrobacter sp. L77]
MRPPLLRTSDGVIAGVCAGLAAHLGIPRSWVRVGMAVLTLASGAGVFLYAWLWIFVPTASDRAAATGRRSGPAAFMHDVGATGPRDGIGGGTDRTAGSLAGVPGGGPGPSGAPPSGAAHAAARSDAAVPFAAESWRDRTERAGHREILFGTALLVAAAVLVVQLLGVPVNWGFLVPIAVVATGAALAWSQLDDVRRARVMNRAGAERAGGALRLFAGMVLVIAGVLVALSSSGSWTLTMATLVAVLAVLAGVGLVLAPWGLKFWRDLESEQAARVRETERAEIAAHLHDSVLQTLALIQNRADSETDVLRLARAQERELRQWLFADPGRDPVSLAERLRGMAGEIEDLYGHPVTVVAVGDAPLGPAEDALAQAAREAMLNAAKHAGVAVSVYLEAGPEAMEVFVRDRGPGFDPAAVPADRLGIRESIHSRMQRHGGTAELRSDADGTEVRLRLPRSTGIPA